VLEQKTIGSVGGVREKKNPLLAQWSFVVIKDGLVYHTHCPEAIRLSAFDVFLLCLSVGHILNRNIIVAIDF
jgi:hypothetical protein